MYDVVIWRYFFEESLNVLYIMFAVNRIEGFAFCSYVFGGNMWLKLGLLGELLYVHIKFIFELYSEYSWGFEWFSVFRYDTK